MKTEIDTNLATKMTLRAVKLVGEIKSELAKFIVGHEKSITELLTAMVAGGHVLLEGIPGIGKTRLIQTLAEVSGLMFRRIQFTPDLMPGDITGSQMLDNVDGKNTMRFEHGPIFANIVLADEINRATPKTQAALLEAMAERMVSAGVERHKIDAPFFVLATQNPIEMAGTYPLPEAQLDRFIIKVIFKMPSEENLADIIELTTGEAEGMPERRCSLDEIIELQEICRQMPLASNLRETIARMVRATHPETDYAPPSVKRYVRSGASPRAAQAIALTAKAHALTCGENHVGFKDLRAVAMPALRHRIVLGLEAHAERKSADDIALEIIEEFCQ